MNSTRGKITFVTTTVNLNCYCNSVRLCTFFTLMYVWVSLIARFPKNLTDRGSLGKVYVASPSETGIKTLEVGDDQTWWATNQGFSQTWNCTEKCRILKVTKISKKCMSEWLLFLVYVAPRAPKHNLPHSGLHKLRICWEGLLLWWQWPIIQSCKALPKIYRMLGWKETHKRPLAR